VCISVAMVDPPLVVAAAHIMIRTILPDGTEVSAAEHDYHACIEISPSATVVLSIVEEPSESLLSGSPDRHRGVFISLHCALFAKSNCFNHMAVSLFILRSEKFKKLVVMKQLFDALLRTSYQDLYEAEQKTVDDAMPYIHWFKVDGGGDCNFNHFRHFFTHLAFFILSKVDKPVIYRSATGHSYLNTVEKVMAVVRLVELIMLHI